MILFPFPPPCFLESNIKRTLHSMRLYLSTELLVTTMTQPRATTKNVNTEKKKRKNKNDNDKGGSKVVTDRSSGSKSSGRGKTGGGRTKARRTPSTGTRPQELSSGTSAKPRRSSSHPLNVKFLVRLAPNKEKIKIKIKDHQQRKNYLHHRNSRLNVKGEE